MIKPCYVCGEGSELDQLLIIDAKPAVETDFQIAEADYKREIYLCRKCGTYNNFHDYDFEALYKGAYNDSTYDNAIVEKYDKIMSFPVDKSDNKHRVKRIVNYFNDRGDAITGKKVLDIGSGLGVFLGEMSKHGVRAYCLDPDPISVQHAKDNIKVEEAYLGSFEEIEISEKFDLIALNKVVEHVKEPLAWMRRVKDMLDDNGIIYLELPDGLNASKHGGFKDREEFYIEHYTVFSEASVRYLVERAGLKIETIDSILEPSGKFTVYAFLRN